MKLQGEWIQTNILITQFVGETNTLWLMFDGPTIDNSLFELILDSPVDGVALNACQRTMNPG